MTVQKREFDPAYFFREQAGERWLFRSVLEFSDGRPLWTGGWNPSSRPEDTAAAVDKRNLLFAYIEGKHFTTKEIRRFADCPGPEFKSFQRLAVLISNSERSMDHVYGMKLNANSYALIALEDGTTRYEQHGKDVTGDDQRNGVPLLPLS